MLIHRIISDELVGCQLSTTGRVQSTHTILSTICHLSVVNSCASLSCALPIFKDEIPTIIVAVKRERPLCDA